MYNVVLSWPARSPDYFDAHTLCRSDDQFTHLLEWWVSDCSTFTKALSAHLFLSYCLEILLLDLCNLIDVFQAHSTDRLRSRRAAALGYTGRS